MTTLLLLLSLSGLLALAAIPSCIALSRRFGLYDFPGEHKRHAQPVSLLGGTALYLCLWGTVLFAFIFVGSVRHDLGPTLIWIYAGASVIYLMGLIDDFIPLTAGWKLLAQTVAGLLIYAGGLKIDLIGLPLVGLVEPGGWSLLVTLLWVIGLTNAINLIDGLDGLAAGVSLIAAMVLAVLGQYYYVGGAEVFIYGVIGFLSVFLVFNWYPARIFLGDSGSHQLGFYFAVISLTVPLKSFTAAALYLPLVALGVPIIETAASFTRRLLSGRSIVKADRRHLFHYLALAGLSPRQVVFIFYLLSAILGLVALAMVYWNRAVLVGLLGLFMVVIFGLFFIFRARSDRWRHRRADP